MAPGCVVIQTGVTNPLPDATTIAIVPFFNQSMERSVNGRRIAEIYQEELQKIPGFQVVPVGRTETELISRGLSLKSPADALILAKAMKVDMIVIGSITDFDPYYPPRIGMHVAWYSPNPQMFSPGVQVDPYARRHFKLTNEVKHQAVDDFYPAETKGWNRLRKVGRVTGVSHATRAFGSFRRGMWDYIKGEEASVYEEEIPADSELEIRSQSPDIIDDSVNANRSRSVPSVMLPPELPSPEMSSEPVPSDIEIPPLVVVEPVLESPQQSSGDCEENCPEEVNSDHHHREHHLVFPDLRKYPGVITSEPYKPLLEFDPLEPVMSYTKIFDARNADVVANLRDYCELNNDLRSGGWKAYLDRTEDYIRFTAHRMIVEMLTLHGGEGKRRFVLKKRKYR
jgi:hypothetical protein